MYTWTLNKRGNSIPWGLKMNTHRNVFETRQLTVLNLELLDEIRVSVHDFSNFLRAHVLFVDSWLLSRLASVGAVFGLFWVLDGFVKEMMRVVGGFCD